MKQKINIKLILFLLSWNIGFSQCIDDIPRYAKYNNMELFNNSTHKYEQFSKSNEINAVVTINTDTKIISFNDSYKNHNQQYSILACNVTDSTIVYNCVDIKNNRKCDFSFSKEKYLTVTYFCDPVIYRVNNLKN